MKMATRAPRRAHTSARSRVRVTLRDVIRNTARELFAHEGYESVSMRRIGAEVGCSPMALYRHYASKEDLLVSICEETFDQMLRAVDRVSGTPGTPLERLRLAINTIIDFYVSHPNHYRVTFTTEIPSAAAHGKAAVSRRAVDRLREAVRECAEAKSMSINVEMATQIIRIAIHGFTSIMINTHRVCPLGDPAVVRQELITTLTRQFE